VGAQSAYGRIAIVNDVLALHVSPVIVDGSLRDEHILPGVAKPEAQLNRTDLEADEGSLDLMALDDVLVRPLPELDCPLLRAEP